MNRFLIILTWCLCFPTNTASAGFNCSFDCTKATHEVEKSICNDGRLSYLDLLLGETYDSLLISNDYPTAKEWRDNLKKDQIDWINKRNSCQNNNCIENEYLSRIKHLVNYSDYCSEFRKRYVIGEIEFIKPIAIGSASELIDIIGRKNLEDSLVKQILEYEKRNAQLFKVHINLDNIDDFVLSYSGGQADCHRFFFLYSSGEGYKLAPGVNFNHYANEASLCSVWGQKMFFYNRLTWGAYRTYAVIQDINGDNTEFTMSLMPISDTVITAEMCNSIIKVTPNDPDYQVHEPDLK